MGREEERAALRAAISDAQINLNAAQADAHRCFNSEASARVRMDAHTKLQAAQWGYIVAKNSLEQFELRAAEDRSVDLLRAVVGEEEYERYRVAGRIRVEGSDGCTYIIDAPGAYNITQLGKGRAIQYCVHPTGTTATDIIVAQVLWLRANAGGLLRAANRRSV